jgi:hypothetical protein
MAKESGLGWTPFSLDDGGGSLQAIVNDVVSCEFDLPVELQEITGLDKSAYERLQLLRDFTFSFESIFNDTATTGVWSVVKTIGTAITSRTLTMVVSGNTLTNEVLLSSSAYSRGDDGAFTIAVEGSLASGTLPAWS